MKTISNISQLIIILLCLAIVVAFFLPWVTIKDPHSKGEGFITRGFRISLIKHSPDVDFLFSAGEKLNLGRDYIQKNGKLVWVYPLLAMIILCLVYLWGRNKLALLLVAASSLAVFLISLYKVSAANLEQVNLRLEISYGLWVTLCAYLAVGIISALTLFGRKPLKTKG
ncbi:MAG: hypothetical protein NC914_00755 [Candidatus Omnitrophica bacterium]|nr:hypothetical protein [Candidatus Omnitrophota bacterium]